MATIKEIAERAGVSIGTVDRVLHNRGKVSASKEAEIRKLIAEMDYKPNSAGQGLVIRQKKLKFSFFSVDPVRFPFYADVLSGAKKKAALLEQYGIQISFHTMDFVNEPVPIHGFEADGIAILGMDNAHTRLLTNWAKQNDKPIVCYNLPLLDSGYLAYVGCDYVQAGRLAAGLCALASGQKGKIGIVSEDDGEVHSFRQRVLGFQQEVWDMYPNMEILGIYFTGKEQRIQAVVQKMFQEHPEIDIVYLVNPGDYSACKSIHEAARQTDIKIITNDLVDQQRSMVKNGVITATICQDPKKQGELPLEILFQYLVNGVVPAEKDFFVNLSIHISQNV